ncbi:MAG: nucleotidyltransferase [Patescibacteria group bacterium]
MNGQEYLEKILENQKLSKEELDELKNHRDEVEGCLREEFGNSPSIRYAGSRAKETMIKESYDLDIVCYFPEDDERSLKEIYGDVKNILSNEYIVEGKTSALRIINLKGSNVDYHIDVVPGRYIDTDKEDAFLYISSADGERMQTNIKVHVETIKESGCQKLIKLTKLWIRRNNLPLKTFVAELSVIEALKSFSDKEKIEEAFTKVLVFFRDDFEDLTLLDPSNSSNVVSDLVDETQKNIVATTAKNATDAIENEEETEAWGIIFKETTGKSNEPIATMNVTPPKPWANV